MQLCVYAHIHACEYEGETCSVVSNSLWPHGLYSTVPGILQARVLEWVAFPFSRGSSQPRDPSRSHALQADSLPADPQGKPMCEYDFMQFYHVLYHVTAPTIKLQNCYHHPFGVFSLFLLLFWEHLLFKNVYLYLMEHSYNNCFKFFDNCNICLTLVFTSLVFSPKESVIFSWFFVCWVVLNCVRNILSIILWNFGCC